MIDFNVIDALIYDWVSTFSGITVIWAEDNSPKPDLPFLSLRRATLANIGHGFASQADNSGIQKISGDRDLIVNIQAFGSNAFGRLDELYNVRLDSNSQELLAAGNLALINQIALTNLTGLNDSEYEERATTDLLFRFASQRTGVDVGYIDKIEVTGNIKNPDKTINFDVDL